MLDQQLSADGRFVVFHTLARDLTPEPDNNEFAGFDVYVRDTVNNTTELVSRTVNGAESGSGFAQRISADGRYVLFQGGRSEGPDGVVPLGSFGAANNGGNHVYRRDLQDDKTVVVTAREDGLGGAGGFPSTSGGAQFDMSDDGRYVVFAYGADDLVTGDTNGQTDVFIRDLVAGTTKLVSRTSGGVSGNGGSGRLIISGNGKTVVFVSGATDLTGTSDTNGDNDLFAYDVATGSVTLITKSADGTSAVSGALRGTKVFFQDIDESGTKIIFSANSNKLVENGSFGEILYLHDTVASTTKLISRLPSGVAAGVDGSGSFISANGKFLSIITGAALTGQTGSTALYLYDVATDAFTLASRNPAGKARNAAGASLSADGRYVAFVSEATDLVPGVTVVEGQNHFVYDRLAGQTFAITTDKTGTQAFGYTVERQRPYISADGRKVAFFIGQSYGFTDNNGTLDVFINYVPLVSPNAPPTITDVVNQSTIVGVAIGPIGFTVADAETAAGAHSVTAKSSNTTLVPTNNVTFGGSGGNRTVTVTPAAGQTGTATITLTVTDGNGFMASDTYTVTVASNSPPTISDVANQTTTVGVAVGPIGFTVGDAETAAGAISVTAKTSNATLIPLNNVKFGGSGANRTVTVTPAADQTGSATITVTITDGNGATASDTFAVTVNEPPPVLVGFPQFLAGSDAGGASVTLFDADGSKLASLQPFPGFTGGVRTAAADFNADGVADIIAGTGPGRATRVVVMDGVTQKQLFTVDPFEASFTGGVYVAAGDVNGDGVPDLAITPDEGGGPRVDMYSGNGFAKIVSFFGIDDVNFRGGARASVADMTGDGVGDLIVVAGFGGGPRVAAFDGTTLSKTPEKIFGDFFAFEQTLRNGIFVTAGDLNGDGFADLIAGGGPGGGPRVLAFDGKSLLSNQYVNLANFFGGDPDSRGGIRLAVKDLDGDNRADLVVGSGSKAGSRVTAYLGKSIAPAGTPPAALDFDSFAGFTGGVFVG